MSSLWKADYLVCNSLVPSIWYSENPPLFSLDKFGNKIYFVELNIEPIMISSVFLVLFGYYRTLSPFYAATYFSALSG